MVLGSSPSGYTNLILEIGVIGNTSVFGAEFIGSSPISPAI